MTKRQLSWQFWHLTTELACSVEKSDQHPVHHPEVNTKCWSQTCTSSLFQTSLSQSSIEKKIDRSYLSVPYLGWHKTKQAYSLCPWLISGMIPFQEDMWAVSALTDQGYTPEPSDLEQLIDIDSKIRLLLPVEEFLSVQNSYTNISMSQVCIQQHFCLHYNRNGFIQSTINSSRHHPALHWDEVIKSYYKVSSVGHWWKHLVKSFVTDPQGVTPPFVSGENSIV